MRMGIAAWLNATHTSKERLAADMGVSLMTVYNWMNHPERLTFEKGKRLADAIGVPIDEIIFLPETQKTVQNKCSDEVV